MPVAQDWNGGADPYEAYNTHARRESHYTRGKGRETRRSDFPSTQTEDEARKQRLGLGKGKPRTDASFACAGVDPYRAPEPNLPPPLPALQRRRFSSSSNYSSQACSYCRMPAHDGYSWGVCHDCASAFPAPLSPRSSSGSKRYPSKRDAYADALKSLDGMIRDSRGRISDVPTIYTPQPNSFQFRRSKTYNPDERHRGRREAQSPSATCSGTPQTSTNKLGARTRGGLPKNPYVFEDEVEGMPEGKPF
jgi:hypothetical protein